MFCRSSSPPGAATGTAMPAGPGGVGTGSVSLGGSELCGSPAVGGTATGTLAATRLPGDPVSISLCTLTLGTTGVVVVGTVAAVCFRVGGVSVLSRSVVLWRGVSVPAFSLCAIRGRWRPLFFLRG